MNRRQNYYFSLNNDSQYLLSFLNVWLQWKQIFFRRRDRILRIYTQEHLLGYFGGFDLNEYKITQKFMVKSKKRYRGNKKT